MRLKSVIIGALLLLSGCGFHPLYTDRSDILNRVSAVRVEPIAGAAGYQMELILKDKLNPQGISSEPKYQLHVDIRAPQYFNQSIRTDNFASLESMNVTATYRMTEIQNNQVVISSSVSLNGLFNLIQDPYATVVAKDNLYDNLIRLMADDIATHVLAYFKGGNP